MTETWKEAFARLAELDGDAWEDEQERLKELWQAEHAQAFIEIAVSRGWSRENAETWLPDVSEYAFIESYLVDYDPRRAAEMDVMCCEEPS